MVVCLDKVLGADLGICPNDWRYVLDEMGGYQLPGQRAKERLRGEHN